MATTATPETAESPESTTRLREQAHAVKDDLRELGKIAKETAKETAGHYVDGSKHKYEEIEDHVVTYIREKPMKSVLIAAGAGLLLGYLFSRR
jgi:ElaB/YqjD/DUF883 family membrane-anchored ribosome-binding protein